MMQPMPLFKGRWLITSAVLIATTGLCGSNTNDSTPSSQDIAEAMRPVPPEVSKSMEALCSFATDSGTPFSPVLVKPLVDFVRNACATDSGWELAKRDGAAGSAYIVKVKVPLTQYLSLNFHPGIPDYAVFPTALRYTSSLNTNEMQHAYACIEAGPSGTLEYVTARMTGIEEITPNPESGCYFSYTNARVFVRGKIDEHDVLFSCAGTLGPSTFSHRGVPVGPLPQALFYYSEKPGLNLTGMTWMLSQIRCSTTVSLYIALNSNETAVATFAWLNAGWKGLNVTRAPHILNTQVTTLDYSRRLAQHPAVNAARLAALVESVEAMSAADVDIDYGRYLSYVRMWRDTKQKPSCYSSLLKNLYDEKAAETIPLSHRRALLVQERVRSLMGVPTWSSLAAPGAVAVNHQPYTP